MEPLTIEVALDLDQHLAGEPIRDHEGEYVGSGPTTLEDVVIGLAARTLVDKLAGPSASYGLTEDERKEIRTRRSAIRDRILEAAAEHAADQTDAMVQQEFDALVARPDDDGRSVIEETIRQTVARRIEEALKLRDEDHRRRSPFGTQRSVLEALVAEHVDRVVANEIKAAISKGKQEVLGEVREQAARAYATALGKINP